MCDINANGPPVGACLHRAIAEERREKGGEWMWHGVRRGRRRKSAGDNWGERWGVDKIRGEKSRKTSRECRSVLRCKCLSALKERESGKE